MTEWEKPKCKDCEHFDRLSHCTLGDFKTQSTDTACMSFDYLEDEETE